MKNLKRGIFPLAIVLSLLLASFASADIVSINSGGSKTTAITPSKNIEGFFLGGSKEEEPEPSPSPGGGGGGGSSDSEKNETDNFELSKNSISVNPRPNETERRCFTITNLKEDEAIFGLNATIEGEISDHTELSKKSFNLMEEMSERACITFSSQGLNEGTWNGETIVSKNETKTIDLTLKVNKPEPVEDPSSSSDSRNLSEGIKDITEAVPEGLRGIKSLILWLPLLLAIMIFLIIKKYSQFMKSISGKNTREERIAQVERMKRASQRSDSNFFEGIINKAAIYMASKTVGEEGKEQERHFS